MDLNEAISGASDRFYQRFVYTLADSAIAAYSTGSAVAADRMDIALNFRMVSEAATKYGKKYENLLIREGSTVINGEKVDWARRLDEDERAEVARIINEGIRAGKPTGKRESTTGHYPTNSIAHDLQQYFDQRKSHASTVARSEVATIQNEAKLDNYEAWNFDRVRVRDGGSKNSCPVCNHLWGRVWSLPFARRHVKEHPNCGRDFSYARPDEPINDSLE